MTTRLSDSQGEYNTDIKKIDIPQEDYAVVNRARNNGTLNLDEAVESCGDRIQASIEVISSKLTPKEYMSELGNNSPEHYHLVMEKVNEYPWKGDLDKFFKIAYTAGFYSLEQKAYLNKMDEMDGIFEERRTNTILLPNGQTEIYNQSSSEGNLPIGKFSDYTFVGWGLWNIKN